MSRLTRKLDAVRLRIADERRSRALGAATVRDVTPPPPHTFGAFGAGTYIVPPARITRADRIFLGDGVGILEHSFLSVAEAVEGVVPRLTIGDGASIGRFAHIACVGEIDIGPQVLTAERIFIGDTYHSYEDPSTPIIEQPMAAPKRVVIGRGAFLGIGCAVLMGVTIGENALVGAGAVVTRDVEPHTVVVGNPAVAIKRWDPATAAWLSV